MRIVGLQTSKRYNNLRVVYLILLLPLFVFLAIVLFFYLIKIGLIDLDIDKTLSSWYYGGIGFLGALPLMILWLVIGISFEKSIIFSFTGAKEVTRKQYPEIYNIVENLAISRGLPTPKIGIIADSSMNAFATGWSTKDSWIVFTTGILKKLDKRELEAVAGHEMTHIMNRDVRVMVIINVFTGMIGTVGYILLRSTNSGGRSSNSKGAGAIAILGLILYLLSLLILPFIALGISRRKEYLADAGSVELTKDRDSMISALGKISKDSRIEIIESRDSNIASMFIANPKRKTSLFSELASTHPSVEKRIEMLQKY